MTIRNFRAALAALCAVLGTGAHLAEADELGRYLLQERLARLESELSGHRGVRLANYQDIATEHDAYVSPTPLEHNESFPQPALQDPPLSMEELPSASAQGYVNGGYEPPCPGGEACETCPVCCDMSACCCSAAPAPMFTCYAECQLVFARPHVLEGGLGAGPNPMKLSEQYDLSPRTIVGVERFDGNGLRARYWHYDEVVADIANGGAAVGFDFEVFDLEGYHRFCMPRGEVTLAGGFRAAHIGTTFDGNWHDNTALGVTVAADGESLLCCTRNQYWSGVYGARLSLLGGDWASSGAGIPALRDDNFTVTELYGGVEHGCRVRAADLYWRLGMELQTWRSDNLSANTNTDSIGFVGPSVQFGASF